VFLGRWTLGDGSLIPAFEEALRGMRAGGIRRIIVPPGTARMLRPAAPAPTSPPPARCVRGPCHTTSLQCDPIHSLSLAPLLRRVAGPLSYPFSADGTQSFKDVGPRPSTFSGRRALDFVLKNNGNIDKVG
jgi:hypothetical protein